MISEYHRPDTLEDALALLSRQEIRSVPIGGGSAFKRSGGEPLAVVDLQALGLNAIRERGIFADLEATVTLQALLDWPRCPENLARAIRHEAAYNLRQVASVAGALASADGRSPFATVMLALDAKVTFREGGDGGQAGEVDLGDMLASRVEWLPGRLITHVTIPLNARLAYHYVARTPADRPVVCAAAAVWPSGRTRVVLGGYGLAPSLAMDGPEAEGAQIAAQDATSAAGDEWASAEYRQQVAGVLVRRCMDELAGL